MIKLLINEFRYSWLVWVLLMLPLPVYSIFSLTNYQLLSGPAFEIDYWGGMYAVYMSILYIIYWGRSSKEKHERIFAQLPVAQKEVAKSRFFFHLIPIIIILAYLVIVQLQLLDRWPAETSSLIGQTGLLFGMFAAIYAAREIWVLTENYGSLFRVMFSASPVVFHITASIGILTLLHFLYNVPDEELSQIIFIYSKILFYINAYVILLIMPFTYQRRKSFLT